MRVENSRFRLFSHSNERTNTLSNSEINESYMCIFRVRAPKKKKKLCTTYSQLAYREQGTRPVRWVRSVYPRRRISSSSTSSSSSIRPSCYADFRCERRWWGDDGVTPFDSNSLSSGLVPVKWHGRLQAGHAAPPARATRGRRLRRAPKPTRADRDRGRTYGPDRSGRGSYSQRRGCRHHRVLLSLSASTTTTRG